MGRQGGKMAEAWRLGSACDGEASGRESGGAEVRREGRRERVRDGIEAGGRCRSRAGQLPRTSRGRGGEMGGDI